MDPMTIMAIASFGLGVMDTFFGGDKGGYQYQPYGPWMDMQNDIYAGIQKGLEEGGFTFSDEIADKLIRKGLEDVGWKYEGAGRRVTERLAPYGNVGAMGRGLVKLEEARAREESGIGTKVKLLQEQTKLKSYENLLRTGGSMGDPTLPGYQGQLMQAQQPSKMSNLLKAGEQGYLTYLNLSQAERDRALWEDIAKGNPTNLLLPNTTRRQTIGTQANPLLYPTA